MWQHLERSSNGAGSSPKVNNQIPDPRVWDEHTKRGACRETAMILKLSPDLIVQKLDWIEEKDVRWVPAQGHFDDISSSCRKWCMEVVHDFDSVMVISEALSTVAAATAFARA